MEFWSYAKTPAATRRRVRIPAESGVSGIAEQVRQAVSLLSLHLDNNNTTTIISASSFSHLISPFVVNWQETKTLWDFSWAACNMKRKIFTCPGHTSSQRCRPLARSRSSSQSFCQTVSRRRTARCNRGSSGCPRHGRPPLGEIFVLKGCWPWMGVGGFCHQYYSLGFDFQCEFLRVTSRYEMIFSEILHFVQHILVILLNILISLCFVMQIFLWAHVLCSKYPLGLGNPLPVLPRRNISLLCLNKYVSKGKHLIDLIPYFGW